MEGGDDFVRGKAKEADGKSRGVRGHGTEDMSLGVGAKGGREDEIEGIGRRVKKGVGGEGERRLVIRIFLYEINVR